MKNSRYVVAPEPEAAFKMVVAAEMQMEHSCPPAPA